MGSIRVILQVITGVFITLLLLFGLAWKTILATLLVSVFFIWCHQRQTPNDTSPVSKSPEHNNSSHSSQENRSQDNTSQGHKSDNHQNHSYQEAVASMQNHLLPKLNKQLEISYQDSHESINQITHRFVKLSQLVKNRNEIDSSFMDTDSKATDCNELTEEKQLLEKDMNRAYNELMELLQHGDRNLQRQAGVMELFGLLIKELRALDFKGEGWDEALLDSEFNRIINRTELAMIKKRSESESDEGVTYF
ncbi:hypothetical protein QF117_12160 [Vibrio sp. YMD68]|uniref:hypothetical protein n=1 Tax=Vibrio sp. YMD68 TaxID=3042300 RepID=UPI00249B481B|nr:hypothetical protein [Vibrio sp. YMD68]WGW01531.1 hypothetical protein QF117_12160 [Vibrio sp. YMD68]